MDANDRRRRASGEAAQWWALLQDKDCSRADREQFVDWLRESAVHVAEMLRIAQVHGALEQFQRWTTISTQGSDDAQDDDNVIPLGGAMLDKTEPPPAPRDPGPPPPAARSPGPNRARLLFAAVAATLVAVAVLGTFFARGWGQIIQTERGERREVALSDGSVLEVDPETRIRVAYESHARRIFLERGRALFRVAKNPQRPFLVRADGMTVRAVGTAFGVERQSQGILVTVAEGTVRVSPLDVPLQSNVSVQKSADYASHPSSHVSTASRVQDTSPPAMTEILVTAGQQVRLAESGSAEPVRTVDPTRELAWARGRLVFDHESVADAVAEFNRYNRVQLKVTDTALAARAVSGVFDASDPESFIAFLGTVNVVHVTRTENEIIMQ